MCENPFAKLVPLLTALIVAGVMPVAAQKLAAGKTPVALLAEVQGLGKGAAGTVVGVVVQVAPEDRERVGERARIALSLLQDRQVIDRHNAVVAVEQDGSVLLYREWAPGSYELEVRLDSLDGTASGLWIHDIEVPAMTEPFAAPDGATMDAVALEVSPPLEGGVRFLPPPDRGGIGGLQLEVEAPESTAGVEFFHDGRSIGRRNRPPWTVSVALGDVIRRTVIKAVAYDVKDRVIGEDALVLNTPTGQLAVEILLGRVSDDGTSRRVTVAVSGAERLQQVSLDLDDEKVARWVRCPCVTELPVAALDKATLLVADAVDSRGIRGDGVLQLQGGGSFSGSVRVELVELPLTVLGADDKPV